jgi:hypothetical protein
VPIRELIAGKSFDPERLFILNVVFECVCADLAVSPTARHSRAIVARKIIELADGLRDSEAIRTAVIASLSNETARA